MEKKGETGRAAASTRPTITLPPRPSMEALFTGGPGASPGPMTLVSSFFADNQSDSPEFRSFSQLLAGAMGSPMAMGFFGSNSTQNSSFNEGGGSEKELGFKQSRPVNLVVARSPMFTVPPGMSPSGLLNSPGFFSPQQSPFGLSHQQVLAQFTAQAALAQSQMHGQARVDYPPASAPATDSLIQHPSFTVDEAPQQSMSDPKSSMMESAEVSHSDRKYQPPADKPTDDGYNWRKYGQKQVKGSEFPRSYYKCTHQKCPVKKKVERSPDGQITEIIIKGQHNHEPPQPNKRSKDGGEATALVHTLPKSEFGSHMYGGNVNKTSEIVHVGFSDSEELCETEITEDRDVDEPNPKRQNIDAGTSGGSLSHKTLTEPKIIVQTRSEVDLLDDGYRWRKYGQKLVKGNPYPRSYYRCTFVGCNVRKHVERASTDPKAVITTYEGKHSHDVPAARNSSHNTANNNTLQIKPQRVVAQKHQLLKEMDFGSKEQRPIVLQLKEEKITV